jgi:Tol biopolymer transport system component
LRQVTHGGYADGGVAWSRDGALLAFTRYSKDTGCAEDQTRGDLYLIGATGKGQRLLSSTGCMFSPPAQPTFALKGQTLAFTDDKGVLLAQAPGWKPRVVLGHGLFPSWAPDARRLVIADGSQIEILDTVTHRTRGVGPGDFAAWSHNGKLTACVTSGGQLWTMDPSCGHRTKLATRAHIDSIAWSPGDDRIGFSSSVGDISTTSWVVPASGGRLLKLGEGAFPN